MVSKQKKRYYLELNPSSIFAVHLLLTSLRISSREVGIQILKHIAILLAIRITGVLLTDMILILTVPDLLDFKHDRFKLFFLMIRICHHRPEDLDRISNQHNIRFLMTFVLLGFIYWISSLIISLRLMPKFF